MSSSTPDTTTPPPDHIRTSFYHYTPSHALPAIFGVLTAISLLLHTYQNQRYRFWRVTHFTVFAAAVFTAGWFVRLASSYNHALAPIGSASAGLYIAQTTFILGGPPIYAAALYCILARLLHYIPYTAPLHPHRVYIFFVYIGALVESLTAAGGAMQARRSDDLSVVRRAETLIAIALVLQGVVALMFVAVTATAHRRLLAALPTRGKGGRLPRNLGVVFVTLYGTIGLMLFRCVFRAIEAFSNIPPSDAAGGALAVANAGEGSWCTGVCEFTRNEWYLYAFEAAPMVVFSFWLNVLHPGRYLPRERLRYLDLVDGRTERMGAGWIDTRSKWETFMDPFDIGGQMKGQPSHEKFWENAGKWPEVQDGSSFALGTASNVKGKRGSGSNAAKAAEIESMMRSDSSERRF